MAFTVTNHGKFYIMNNAITSSTDIRAWLACEMTGPRRSVGPDRVLA
jgi:hypothetical protein